jgi:hypothetical protein
VVTGFGEPCNIDTAELPAPPADHGE